MGIEPKNLLAWANSCQDCEDEVQVRAGISRAYYSALHQTRSCFQIVLSKHESNTHKKTIDHLALLSKSLRQGRTVAAQTVQLLIKLKINRVAADYELNLDITLKDLKNSLAIANRILEFCEDVDRQLSK